MKDTKLKVRIRPSAQARGRWYACLVRDKPRDTHGVVQYPIGYPGAVGRTPMEAYCNLMETL